MSTTEAPLPLAAEATTPTGSTWIGRRTILAALRSELIKTTTVRSTGVLVAGSALVGLLTSSAIAVFVADEGRTVTDVFLFPMVLTAVLAAIAGILVITSEVQHGTLAASFTAHPSRWPVVAAKIGVTAGFGFVLGLIGTIAGFAGAVLGGLEVGDTSGVTAQVLWGLLYTVGAGLLGLGVGMVVRHSAGAISGLLVWWLVVEGLVVSFAPPETARFMPFDTGFRTLGVETGMDVPEVVAAGLSNPLHASIFWGYVVTALVLGAAVLVRRDAD